MSTTKKGIKYTIAMYDLEGHLLEVFKTDLLKDLADLLGVDPSSLSNAINGRVLTLKNRQFFQSSSDKVLYKVGDVSSIENQSGIPVHKYYKDNYITTYPNIDMAADKNRIPRSSLTSGLADNDGVFIYDDFTWKYA